MTRARPSALPVALVAALLLAACSRLDIAYSQLDWVLTWYVDGYVTLTSDQGGLMRERVNALKRWHCTDEVPAYARWVRGTGQELAGAPTVAALDARFAEFEQALRRLGRQAAPEIADLLLTASPEQVDALQASLRKRDEKFRAEWVDIPREQLDAKRAAWMVKHLERWLGPLDAAQRARVEAWSRQLIPTAADTLAFREAWRAALDDALKRRDRPDAFRTRIADLVGDPRRLAPPSREARFLENRRITWEMLVDVAGRMSPEQRRTLLARTGGLAGELEALACGAEAPERAAVETER